MYESFFGLRERPFDLSPNPRFLFLSVGHRAALTHLKYGLTGRPGLTVLIGEAGTGKTTLVMAALKSHEGPGAHIVHLANPTLTRAEFYQYLASGYQFSEAAAASKAVFLRELGEFLIQAHRRSMQVALIVDESQSLPHELLEEIRLLTNLETSEGRSLSVVLVGQPELSGRLNDVSLRQLKQRIALRCELAPLTLQETAAYIAARVRVAGGQAERLFTRDAVKTIYDFSAGIPRTISVICDNALVNGFAADLKPVTREVVMEVSRDFHLAELPSADVPPPIANPRPVEVRPAASIPSPERPPDHVQPVTGRQPLFSVFGQRKRFSFF